MMPVLRLLPRYPSMIYPIRFLILILLMANTPVMAGGKPLPPGTTSSSIVIIGASYARGWQPTTLAGLKVTNKGAGGEETIQIHSRFPQDVIATKPRAVIIWGFINDIFRSQPQQLEKKLEVSKKNIMAMVDAARRNKIVPILATEVTIRGPGSVMDSMITWLGDLLGKRSYQSKINEHVISMNSWLREYAEREKIAVLDFQPVLADDRGYRKKEYASEDGSHLSPAAYTVLTNYAEPKLQQILAQRQQR